jgi:hypothetical protein
MSMVFNYNNQKPLHISNFFSHEKNPMLVVSQSFAHEGHHVEKKFPSLE